MNCGTGSAFDIEFFVKLLKRTLRTAESATMDETAAATTAAEEKVEMN